MSDSRFQRVPCESTSGMMSSDRLNRFPMFRHIAEIPGSMEGGDSSRPLTSELSPLPPCRMDINRPACVSGRFNPPNRDIAIQAQPHGKH